MQNLKCILCGGKIGTGEPVRIQEIGLAHYFKHWCDYEREEQEKALLAGPKQ